MATAGRFATLTRAADDGRCAPAGTTVAAQASVMQNHIESAIAKVAGLTAAVDARFKGLRGVFTTLAKQHHEVDALLTGAQATTDFVKRAELWRQIRVELISHEQAEHLEIYPVLEAYEATQGIARTHTAHSAELERLIGFLDETNVQSTHWQPILVQLIAKFHEHVQLEEQEFFARAQAFLGDAAAKALVQPFLRAKELAKRELEAGARA